MILGQGNNQVYLFLYITEKYRLVERERETFLTSTYGYRSLYTYAYTRMNLNICITMHQCIDTHIHAHTFLYKVWFGFFV